MERIVRICKSCGKKFTTRYDEGAEICPKCIKKLPQCFSCGCVIGPGYLETSLYKCGDHNICGGCHQKLKEKGYLLILEGKFLMPNGEIISKNPRRVQIFNLIQGGKNVKTHS